MEFHKKDAIYLQIADLMCERILRGTWPENERIPSVRELQSQAQAKKERVRTAKRVSIVDSLVDEFPFLGRPNNLNARSLLSKIRAHNKENKNESS